MLTSSYCYYYYCNCYSSYLQTYHLQVNPTDTSYHLTPDILERATETQLKNWLNLHRDCINLEIKVRDKAVKNWQHLITDIFGTSLGPPT